MTFKIHKIFLLSLHSVALPDDYKIVVDKLRNVTFENVTHFIRYPKGS